MTEIVPLIYFSHAELKHPEDIQARLELITTENKTSSLTKSKVSKKFKLNIEDADMNYEAIEEDESPFLVGILDKNTQDITMSSTPYFILKPECYLGTRTKSESLSVNPESTYSEKLNALTAAFGSSKKRKAMQTKLKNKIDTETLESAVNAAVEESKQNVNLNQIEDNQENVQNLEQFSIIPIPNKNAKAPLEVYDLNEILGVTHAEFDRFTGEQSSKFASATTELIKSWKAKRIYSEYVCEHAILISGSKSSHQYKLQKAKQLVYINYLMAIYKLKSSQLRARNPFNSNDVPEVVANRLLEQYTVLSASNAQAKNVRSMPRRLKDKLVCHILILALYIDDFVTCLDFFQKDLKLSIKKISDFYQALGCFIKNTVTTVNNKKMVVKKAELKIPLNETNRLEGKKRSKKK